MINMNHFRNNIKRVLFLATAGVFILNSTACGKTTRDMYSTYQNNVNSDLTSRMELNSKLADGLYNSGVITEEEHTKIVNNINSVKSAVSSLNLSEDMSVSTYEDADKQLAELYNKSIGGSSMFQAISAVAPIASIDPEKLAVGEADKIDNTLKLASTANFLLTSKRMFSMSDSAIKNNSCSWVCRSGIMTNDSIIQKDSIKTGEGKTLNFNISRSKLDKGKVKPIDLIGDITLSSLSTYKIYTMKPEVVASKNSSGNAAPVSDLMKVVNDTLSGTVSVDDYWNCSDLSMVDLILDGQGKSDANKLIKELIVETKLPENCVPDANGRFSTSQGEDIIIAQQISGKMSDDGKNIDYSNGTVIPAATIRLREFDKEKGEQLCNLLSSFSDGSCRFKIDNKTKRVYLMEYPIETLSSFKVSSVNTPAKNTLLATAYFSKSGLLMNIETGRIYKCYKSSSGYSANGSYIDEVGENYFSDSSSFAVLGWTFLPAGIQFDSNSGSYDVATGQSSKKSTRTADLTHTPVPRIIMLDYLEATCAKGYQTNDGLASVVFGRKIRLRTGNRQTYNGQTIFGVYEDTKNKTKSGMCDYTLVYSNFTTESITNTNVESSGYECADYMGASGITGSDKSIHVTDFIDMHKSSYTQVYKMGNSGIANGNAQIQADSEATNDTQDISEVKTQLITSGNISVGKLFPSSDIGKEDFALEEASVKNRSDEYDRRPRFACLALRTGLFNSALYTNWIQSDDPSYSLNWWNRYLDNNNFKYSVDQHEVEAFLEQHFADHVSAFDDTASLNSATLKQMQEIIDTEAKEKTNRIIRTVFSIFGLLIICLALILPLFWAIDTNADIGLALLTKATFGNWVAIKYESDIPKNDTSNCYISGYGVLWRSIVLITVGILMYQVDIFLIVKVLISAFGGIAEWFSTMITGDKLPQ